MTTPLDLLGADEREVTTVDRDGTPATRQVLRRAYRTDPEDLWEALTDPERIVRWFMPISGELQVGGRYALQGNAEGEILTCEAPRLLEVTWEFGGQVTWVTLTLRPQGDTTVLELAHVAHVPEEMWAQFGPGATGVGWDLSFMGLGLHLAGGGDVTADFDPETWPTTPEGRAAITGFSEAWGQAWLADGGDPDAVAAATAATTAFYTGDA